MRRLWEGAKAADTTLSLFDLALRVIGISTVLSSLATMVAWVAANFYTALVVGLVAWILIAVLLLVVMSYRRQIPAPVGAGQDSLAQQNASEQDRLRAEIREQERERQQLISSAQQREAEIKQLQEWNEQLASERDAFRERAEQATEVLQAQPDDEELKQRCGKLVSELSEFANERAQGHPQKAQPLSIRAALPYNTETQNRYEQRFGLETAIVLDGLEQRGHMDAKEVKKYGNPSMAQTVENLQTLARRLAALCERL